MTAVGQMSGVAESSFLHYLWFVFFHVSCLVGLFFPSPPRLIWSYSYLQTSTLISGGRNANAHFASDLSASTPDLIFSDVQCFATNENGDERKRPSRPEQNRTSRRQTCIAARSRRRRRRIA